MNAKIAKKLRKQNRKSYAEWLQIINDAGFLTRFKTAVRIIFKKF